MDKPPDYIGIPGGYISLLPKEIISYMMFKYLSFDSIKKCYLTDRVFHCLGGNPLETIKKVSKGWPHNVKEGNLDACQWIYQSKRINKKRKFINNGFKMAALYGKLPICQWLYDLSLSLEVPLKLNSPLIKNSIEHTNAETMEWLYNLVIGIGKQVDVMRDIFIPSQEKGNLEVCQWAYKLIVDNQIHINSWDITMEHSMKNGHFNVMKWIHDELYSLYGIIYIQYNHQIHLQNDFEKSCKRGHLDIAKWVHDKGIELSHPVNINRDVYEGIDYYYSYSQKNKTKLFKICVNNKYFDVASYLYSLNEFDMQIMETTFVECCEKNNFETVKWLHNLSLEAKKPLNINIYQCAFDYAQEHRNLEFGIWLYKVLLDNVSSVDAFESIKPKFIGACKSGFLEFVKLIYDYAIERNLQASINKIEILQDAFNGSCINGHLEVVQWVYNLSLEVGVPIDITSNYKIFLLSYDNRHYNVTKWLYELNKKGGKPIDLDNTGLNNNELIKYGMIIPSAKKWLHTLDSIKVI